MSMWANPNSGAPLHIAVERKHLKMTAILLENGANVDARNFSLDTSLHIAIKNGDLDTIAALLGAGANVNIARDSGETALMMALEKGLHGVAEELLQAGALSKEPIRQQLATTTLDDRQVVEIVAYWDISEFVHSQLPNEKVVEDLRKVVTLTGSVKNSQLMSCEGYVAQTWHDSGLDILDTLIKALKVGDAESNIDDRRVTFRSYGASVMGILIWGATQSHIVDIMEQIAWLGCVFTCKQREHSHGPFLATANYWFSSTSPILHLPVQNYSLDGYLNEPCWTNILRKATLAVGFPVRKRKEGLGLEIPFPLLLLFADISVSMDYDGGTLLVGESTILFPAQQLVDGIQWHIADARSGQEAVQVIAQSSEWIRTNDIGQLAQHRAYLGYSHALVLLGTRKAIKFQRPPLSFHVGCQRPGLRLNWYVKVLWVPVSSSEESLT